ncbi:tetraspanin-8-like isoform X2 [Simochromis diagramma]|uniref:tetraspanin-8-like isoform X2 n=1 Tax=Simochromis diagramma TaxID=43689 RepID=UPI001A7ED1E8|nr:tetraspanin-8-like isoform X2 [Simochromis diagramma]
MGKINEPLKRIFVGFNSFFAILGCTLIYLAIQASASGTQMSSIDMPGFVWILVFAIGVLCVSILGIYAASSEKVLALKIFAGFMGIGMITMMIFGIITAVGRNQLKAAFTSPSSEEVYTYMKKQEVRSSLQELQQTFKCCGIVSAKDWGDQIPNSCECWSSRGYECTSKPQGIRGPDQIYVKSCGEFIFSSMDGYIKISIGFCFGFAVVALLGLLIAIFMIHQVKQNDTAGTVYAMRSY